MDQRPGSTPKTVAASLGAGGLACLGFLVLTVLAWLGMVALWDALDLPDNFYLCVGSPLIAAGVAALFILPAGLALRQRRWLGWSVGLGALAGSLIVPLLFFLALGVFWLIVRYLCSGNPNMAGC